MLKEGKNTPQKNINIVKKCIFTGGVKLRKIKLFLLVCASFFIITSVDFVIPNNAEAAFKCYSGERCKSVTLTYGKDISKKSANLYLYKGETGTVDFETNSNSKHQVAFAAYDYDGKRVSNWGYATYAGGWAAKDFTVPYTGSYYIKAYCKGGETNTCSGGGTISKK
ncbi:hypothetical protein ABEY44_25740 [Priestia megaterium]